MSRKIWLIRHAMPDIPLGERWCVGGRSNFPLGRLGKLQAALLPFLPELQGLGAVFCSSLLRARETALPLCPAPREMPGLQEQDMGLWDGLSFREIRQRYPALYAARERDPALLPQGAESVEAVRRRMTEGILRCLRESEGTIAIVSHKGSIASITGQREKLGYTSLTLLEAEREELRVLSVGQAPHPALTEEVCRALMHAAGAYKTHTPWKLHLCLCTLRHCEINMQMTIFLDPSHLDIAEACSHRSLHIAKMLRDTWRKSKNPPPILYRTQTGKISIKPAQNCPVHRMIMRIHGGIFF